MDPVPATDRRRIALRAFSIALATTPFGLTFGAVASASGLTLMETMGFSPFRLHRVGAVRRSGILGEGGAIGAAVSAGLLLNLRSLAFGILLAPDLRGPVWWRALVSQLMIDESTAVATVEKDTASRRLGFLAGGVAVFALFNLATLLGALVVSTAGDAITRYGLDATIPAAFVGLLWPRMGEADQRRVALVGAAIALALTPFLLPGMVVVAAVAAVLAGKHS